jgi:hypothetical protein
MYTTVLPVLLSCLSSDRIIFQLEVDVRFWTVPEGRMRTAPVPPKRCGFVQMQIKTRTTSIFSCVIIFLRWRELFVCDQVKYKDVDWNQPEPGLKTEDTEAWTEYDEPADLTTHQVAYLHLANFVVWKLRILRLGQSLVNLTSLHTSSAAGPDLESGYFVALCNRIR